MSIFNNKKIGLFLLVAGFLLVSCGTSRKQAKALSAKPVAELTPEQQRKYDYFFLEAARLKIQKDYDAAFDLLQHCLTINPNASSALYELAQYYLFLKQVPPAAAGRCLRQPGRHRGGEPQEPVHAAGAAGIRSPGRGPRRADALPL